MKTFICITIRVTILCIRKGENKGMCFMINYLSGAVTESAIYMIYTGKPDFLPLHKFAESAEPYVAQHDPDDLHQVPHL